MADDTVSRRHIALFGHAGMAYSAVLVRRFCMYIIHIMAVQAHIDMRTRGICAHGGGVAADAGASVVFNQVAIARIPVWMANDARARGNISRTGSTAVAGGTNVVGRYCMHIIRIMTGPADAVVLGGYGGSSRYGGGGRRSARRSGGSR